MRYFKLLVPFMVLSLMGAGCLGLGGGSSSADGGVWKSQDAGLSWVQSVAIPTSQGVGSLAGTNIYDISQDPQDNQALYIGTSSNGLLFSYDSGVSWLQPRQSELRSGTVNIVKVDPNDKCTVYAVRKTSLAKSKDCSRTFNTEVYVESRPGVTITDIEVDWYDSNVVWLATSEGDVIKSTDAGDNWTTVARLNYEVVDIMVDNADSRIVYAALKRKGLQKTMDSGATWIDLEDTFSDNTAKRMLALAQDAEGSVLLASTEYGMFRSTDNADSWEEIQMITAPEEVEITALAIDPNNTDVIYYTTSSTFYSTIDGGVNWQTRRLPTLREPTDLVVDFEDGNMLYMGGISQD